MNGMGPKILKPMIALTGVFIAAFLAASAIKFLVSLFI
jgi:hypothetical protein